MRLLSKIIKKIQEGGLLYATTIVTKRTIESIQLMVSHCLFAGCKTENIIVIESHNDFDCNGGAFYDYLIANKANEEWKIIWLLRNELKNTLPPNVYAFDFQRFSLKKEYMINKAKYLMYDDKAIKKRRKKQLLIYCQHGLSIKNVKGHINAPNEVDFILSSSENYDPILCKNISVPYPNNKMLHYGYLYNDILFKTINDERTKITDKTFQKTIIWMPTFRKKNNHRNDSTAEFPLGIPLIVSLEELYKLNLKLKTLDCLLIIKIHPMQYQDSYKDLVDLSNILIIDGKKAKDLGVDNYRLMKFCDAMISDYSSVAYSYLLLNRPIGFVLSDLDQYKIGFSVDNYEDFLPGPHIYTFDDFVDFIENICHENDSYSVARQKLIHYLYTYVDGKSCERLANFLEI